MTTATGGGAKARYPEVKVRLTGEDGNAFAILGKCRAAARRAGVEAREVEAFTAEATAGNHDNLLRVCLAWFDVS